MISMQYCADTFNPAAPEPAAGPGAARAVQAGYIAADGARPEAPARQDGRNDPLRQVAGGILGNASPRQFMESVNAGNRLLGNRAFVDWVGQLHPPDKDGAGQVPLQMMPKRDKRDHDPAADADSVPDLEDDPDEFMANYFPAMFAVFNLLVNRAGNIRTADHDALSLPGAGNMLATTMLGLLMVGLGLPLDIFTNILGGIARCIMLLSDVFIGKPATWLLDLYFKHNPPSAADRARVTSDTLPKGPPRGIDWSVSVPELIAISGISAYWQAGSTQSSLSPRLWLQPWTGGRIASIVFRTLVNDVVYLLQFTVFPQISRRVLQNRLHWSETRSGLFVSILNNIFDVVSSYILSYLTNLSLAVYLVFQNLIEDNGLTPSEAAAAVVGYTALGIFIQTASEAIFEHFVVSKVNEKKLVPWLNQFRAIPDRVVRTMAIALASFRNVIINVMSISLTTGQLSANIIGPLSTRFGEGGACFWPLAVAEVCGELPAGFNQTAQDERIAAGSANMSFGQLFAIQLFPWLVGLIGLGFPIAYVVYRYRQVRRAGRRTGPFELDDLGPDSPDDEDMTPQSGMPDSPSAMSAAGPASMEFHEEQLQAPASGQPGEANSLTAQMLFEYLLRQDGLTPARLRQVLAQHLAGGDITDEEATLIEEMVRDNVVLSKPGQ